MLTRNDDPLGMKVNFATVDSIDFNFANQSAFSAQSSTPSTPLPPPTNNFNLLDGTSFLLLDGTNLLLL